MIKKKDFFLIVSVLLIIIITQTIIIINPRTSGYNEVTIPENAITIAKAALLEKYGEAEVYGMEFVALKSWDSPNYWHVTEDDPYRLGIGPHVLVRMSDGKAILRWKE